MSSDAEYAAFLEKANQDPSIGAGPTQSALRAEKMDFHTTDSGVAIPKVLKEETDSGKWVYTSDADEPFVPVALHFSRSRLPEQYEFAELIHHPHPKDADIEILDTKTWDPRGAYHDLVEIVRDVCGGTDIKVFKVAHGGSRVEYWLVGSKDGKLLGVKALSIES